MLSSYQHSTGSCFTDLFYSKNKLSKKWQHKKNMSKMIAFGESAICSLKSNKRLISCSHSRFSSFLRIWNICGTKVPEVPGEGRDPLLQKQTQNYAAHPRDQQRNAICSPVPVFRPAPLLSEAPFLWTLPSLERRGTSLKSTQKVWKILTCLTSRCGRILL